MESIQDNEKIKKNVVILGWVLIAIHLFGFYQIVSSASHVSDMSGMMGGKIPGFSGYWSAYSIQILGTLGMLIDLLFIYFSWKMINFNEKGRSWVAFLLILQVLITIAYLILSVFISLPGPYYKGGYQFFTFGFITIWIRLLMFDGALIIFYYLTYNFLNKPETKAVFENISPNTNGNENGN